MRIAVTADAHLRRGSERPERFNAVENVFKQTVDGGIENLIIAGDLFDKDFQDYSEFESLCKKYPALQLHIIPGNHDPAISEKSITGDNVHIYSEPTIREFDSVKFLFVPYEKDAKMGEAVAGKQSDIAGVPWVLVGHGDFFGGVKEPNPLETGTYMPLSRSDLGRFKPKTVFLGHIHKPHDPVSGVTYVGSPCGLDISESGPRRFLIYDTSDGISQSRAINTDVLYFSKSFLVLPRESEVAQLEQEISTWIESWGIDSSDRQKVCIRVEAKGYAKDRGAILQALKVGFDEFTYFKDEGPKIEQLLGVSDDQLEDLAEHVIQRIGELDWPFGGDEPTREQVGLAALSVIYGT